MVSTRTGGARSTTSDPTRVRQARNATYAAFIGSGFAIASWAARIPQVRNQLGLDAQQLGLVLFAIAAGSVLSMPLSGVIISRIGSRRTVTVTAVLLAAALVVVGVSSSYGVPGVVIGLFLFGVANGSWDVAMNVQGAAVERLIGRAILPRFHAGWSLGTVAGALIGAGVVALGVPVAVHLVVVAVVVGVAVPWSVRRFVEESDLPDEAGTGAGAETGTDGATDGAATDRPKVSVLRAWREPRTLLIGLFVLAFAFAEGTGNDWIAIALIDGRGLSPAIGTLGFAFFLAAMTLGRWFGTILLDRFGRVRLLRLCCVVAIAGLLIFVFSPFAVLGFAGALVWGLGTSLGFPVGMSAASDEPAMAAPRVSVVASIGYCAFLGGPPLIGFLGSEVTVIRALSAVAVLLVVALLIAGQLQPRKTEDPAPRG